MWQTAPHNAVSHWFSMQRKADTLPIISAEVPALIASGGAGCCTHRLRRWTHKEPLTDKLKFTLLSLHIPVGHSLSPYDIIPKAF